MKLDIHEFDDYFNSTLNVDEYVCGCGCGQSLPFVHGFAERIRKDLLMRFK